MRLWTVPGKVLASILLCFWALPSTGWSERRQQWGWRLALCLFPEHFHFLTSRLLRGKMMEPSTSVCKFQWFPNMSTCLPIPTALTVAAFQIPTGHRHPSPQPCLGKIRLRILQENWGCLAGIRLHCPIPSPVLPLLLLTRCASQLNPFKTTITVLIKSRTKWLLPSLSVPWHPPSLFRTPSHLI